ncbi:MAG: aminoglycoside phosphotransferase family protein [Gaiellaceae bacterium]
MPVTAARIASVLGVEHVRREPWPYASSLPMERIEIEGAPALLFKDLTRSEELHRPGFLSDRRREINAYAHVLGDVGVDAPRYRASLVDADRAWLFLELVDGVPLWQVGELEVWQEAARCLAALHASPEPASARLLRYDAEHLRRRFALAGSLPRVAEIGIRVAERLAGLPTVLIHGEFYASNVLVQREPGRVRVRPVDWETVGVGPGVLDLAALTAGAWDGARRMEIERAYLDACPPELRPGPGDLDYARLLLAAQWTGWSPGWSPPPEHRQDWAAVALELIGRLEL